MSFLIYFLINSSSLFCFHSYTKSFQLQVFSISSQEKVIMKFQKSFLPLGFPTLLLIYGPQTVCSRGTDPLENVKCCVASMTLLL